MKTLSRPRSVRGRLLGILLLAVALPAIASTQLYIPTDDSEVLAQIPAGARHLQSSAYDLTRKRIDIALPLAKIQIGRARESGDPRFLGYAETALKPWMAQKNPPAAVRVLQATLLQSRHEFEPALIQLDAALKDNANDAQAWLTRATVLRVLGRYPEALASCERITALGDSAIGLLCHESIKALNGQLDSAYAALSTLDDKMLPASARAWRLSELGEMAVRKGDDATAERWFVSGLKLTPKDLYLRAAYADLLLRQRRSDEVLQLLAGQQDIEPLLLRIALAQQMGADKAADQSRERLATLFDTEAQRGAAVHRREQARFLLDIEQQPRDALLAARNNWRQQREPEDVLIFLRAAQAAHMPQAAAPVVEFVKSNGLRDARFDALIAGWP